MRIAVIGSGIAGLTAAYLLARKHEVTLFEADSRPGGHTHTVHVDEGGRAVPVDTGFIVFNDRTYPNFIKLMGQLGVGSQDSSMSFSVRCERTGLEYNGTTLRTLFSQKRNALRPSFIRMLLEILRFNREAPAALSEEGDRTLGDYIAERGYSKFFRTYYIVPMGAAIWSAPPDRMLDFPLRFFVAFLRNHGMLSVNDRPVWRTITGGSSAYIEPLTRPFRDSIRLGARVVGVTRAERSVSVRWWEGAGDSHVQSFDHAVLACHADQALSVLTDATPAEREVLGAMPFQENEAVLHTDASVMPRRRMSWAAWNYHLPHEHASRVPVTYNMNILQGISSPTQYCVTLNHAAGIDPAKIIRRIVYHHPQYTLAGVRARERWGEISGRARTHFCGAYWMNGFHEDGVNSALRVCGAFGEKL